MNPLRIFVACAVACALGLIFMQGLRSVWAKDLCGPADQVTVGFARGGSKIVAEFTAVTDSGPVKMRLFAHPKSGRWALLVLSDDGLACLVMVGEGYSSGRLEGPF